MNKITQAAIVAAVSRGADKGRFGAAAQSASGRATIFIQGKCVRRKKTLAADRADAAGDPVNGVEALPAHREAGNVNQRLAAQAAIGGK